MHLRHSIAYISFGLSLVQAGNMVPGDAAAFASVIVLVVYKIKQYRNYPRIIHTLNAKYLIEVALHWCAWGER